MRERAADASGQLLARCQSARSQLATAALILMTAASLWSLEMKAQKLVAFILVTSCLFFKSSRRRGRASHRCSGTFHRQNPSQGPRSSIYFKADPSCLSRLNGFFRRSPCIRYSSWNLSSSIKMHLTGHFICTHCYNINNWKGNPSWHSKMIPLAI